ncbi:hypothetical protein EFW57_02540 [Bacillus velezensis]|nr:hypothetical protein EFW57_02540 [Bacillus velezensis]
MVHPRPAAINGFFEALPPGGKRLFWRSGRYAVRKNNKLNSAIRSEI